MKNGIKLFAALSFAFTSMIGTSAMVNHVAATTAIQCDCGKSNCNSGCRLRQKRTCRSCDTQCGCVQCPQCEGEICKLELDKSDVKKTCFKVEQKAVCVPAVRLPWKKCCPPGTSKTRTINVLKKHSYKCPNCAYQWKLHEPEICDPPPSVQPAAAPIPTISKALNFKKFAPRAAGVKFKPQNWQLLKR